MSTPSAGSEFLLEVCIASVVDAIAAHGSGADRLEVNSALELGGLTPADGLVEEIKRETHLPVVAMLRPRPAGFCYSQRELLVMCRDAERLLEAGADQLIFGILTPEKKIDVAACKTLLRVGEPRKAVFHRAFDVVGDQIAALECLIDLGFERVLTSGRAATVIEGCDVIASLQRQARGRITIMPGGGICANNILDILRRTGCREVHGSFHSEFFDDSGPVSANVYWRADSNKISAVRALLNSGSLR